MSNASKAKQSQAEPSQSKSSRPAPSQADLQKAHAIWQKRMRQRQMAGTFLVAVALALQLGQQGSLADDNLILTAPLVFLGSFLSGFALRPSAALAMGAAGVAAISAFGVAQSGSFYTDEILLFAIPFSATAAIVVGHVRNWAGKTAAAFAIALSALSIGIGMTEYPSVFAVIHLATLVTLPTVPVR